MKIFRKLVFVFSLCFALSGAGIGQSSHAALAFDRELHDFGTIRKGENRVAEFTVTNRGEGSLALTGVKTTCNCTKVRWSRKPLRPGESATLTVVYQAKDPGAFYKEIEIQTNVDPQPRVIRVKGVIEP